MENPKQQLIERLRTANNVLVSVSTNPSVDQLAAAIGLTLMLNKLGKHGTAVFSGQVPSILEFLQPEKTLEKNTDSLRDFIIALDKSKADKLRYKVEDNFVRIFITPYRTSITEKDLDFSQGDFNVEVVVALGVHDQKDLDRAITAHGRILHDATTFSLTTSESSSLGSVNWADANASSLCEMVAGLANQFQSQSTVLDEQIATALLTGIVAETQRFSNQKTSPLTMSLSSALMSAGANQQLVASKLEEPKPESAKPAEKPTGKNQHKAAKSAQKEGTDDGALQIAHEADKKPEPPHASEAPQPAPIPIAEQIDDTEDDLVIDEDGTIQLPATEPGPQIQGGSDRIDQPPSLGGKLTANTEPEQLDPATDPLGAGQHATPLLSHEEAAPVADTPDEEDYLAAPGPQTLSQLEQAVDSPHTAAAEQSQTDVGGARDAVTDALASMGEADDPITGLNAKPLGDNLNQSIPDVPFTMPENLVPPATPATDVTAAPAETPTAPPTVPPPFMPTIPAPDIQIDPVTGNIMPQQSPEPNQPNNPFNLPPS